MSEQAAAGPSGPSGAWRVGDRDRDAAARALGEHYAAGRLDKEEYDERADRAYAARTDRDLDVLFTDLPLPHPPAVQTPAPSTTPPTTPSTLVTASRPAARRPVRGPFGPWLLVAIPVAVLTGAYWLLWLVPVLLWCVVRPARRHGWRGPAWRV